MPAYTIDRRRLLAGAGSLAVLAGAGGALTGCNNSTDTNNTAEKNTAAKLPTYKQYTGLKPDLPSMENGVDAGFRLFPKDNPKATTDKPGTGSESISGMANIYYAIPPGPDSNKYWAGLNDRLGVDLKLQMVPNADYGQKFPVVIAGNDIPDMIMLTQPPTNIPNLPALLQAKFSDLGPHLAGDAINDYPNLANIPTRHWKASVYNGSIYGIPIPRGAVGNYNFIRQDLFEAKGLSTEPGSYDELLATCKSLTDAGKKQWAFSLGANCFNLLQRMNEAPNVWRNENGTLTHAYETDEYKQALTDMVEFWKAGVIHPDGYSATQPFKQLFNAGTCAINALDGYPGWTEYILDNADNKSFKLGLMPIAKRAGSGLAPWFTGSGYFSLCSIKKQSDDNKLKLILRVLNWLAAPFGTDEYKYRLFGNEGVDYTTDSKGNPTLTKTGTADTVLPIRYLADSPYTLYQPGRPDDADTQYEYQKKILATQTADPTVGLYSNTAATKGPTIGTKITDGIQGIILGRQPMSDFDGLVKAWKSGGGDQIRDEFQQQLQSGSVPSASTS